MSRVLAFEDAARTARRQFLANADLDMQALAADLAVGRATLYRVVGGRDRLLGHILTELGAVTQADAMAKAAVAHPPGVERVVHAGYLMNVDVAGFPPLRRLIRKDPATAFRVLFTEAGGVHEASVAAWTPAIGKAVEVDGVVRSRDAGRLAYLFVRIGESMIYADLLSSREPDLELARDLHRALLTLP